MKLEVPDSLAPQLEALLAKLPLNATAGYADRQSVSAGIYLLQTQWKQLPPTLRGSYIDRTLKACPDLSIKTLADLIGVSAPAVGYHRRFATVLSQADQQLLDDKVITIPEAIGRCREQLAVSLVERAEDLECAAEVAPATKQILPDYIADRIVSPLEPFVRASSLASSSESPAALEGEILPIAPIWEPPSRRAANLDGAYESFRDWVGWYGAPKACEQRNPGKIIKRIIINDLHIPYMCEDSFRRMIDAEAADTDELIIAGDVATMANFSAFPKYSRTYTPVEGFVETTKVMQYLNEVFPSVKVFSGNHDNRFIKWLVKDKGVPPEILEYFECLAPNFTDPLRIVCKDLVNVEVIQPIEYEKASFNFLYQFGDFVVTHAETYSKIPNRAASNVNHWIKSFAEPCGIVGRKSRAGKDVRCVGQAHTHQAGKVFSDFGTWAFELGCMTKMEEYVGSPRIMTPRPWVLGYTRVLQDEEGNTLINDSNFIHTGKF